MCLGRFRPEGLLATSSWMTALHGGLKGRKAAMPASLIGPFCQAQSILIFGVVEQNVSVQLTLLYAVAPVPKVGAARIGQTERRATLLEAL